MNVFAEAMATRLKLAAEGKLLELAQFRERSGLSRQAIQQQINSEALFTVDGPEDVTYYPAFFADTQCDQATVRRVARALKGLAGGSKWIFFTSPRLSLDGLTPLEVIRGATFERHDEGRTGGTGVGLPAVLRAAAAYIEQ
ncbi:hypothetical protein [Paraburkholderia caribensis]|uniref:hypothetical protein n=1 Tax=Paraburkholderia caribensis TaxID=75105 RepID=UPI002857AF68|nr:hypothetical protein [Paraburkholderia caribensis]MDR6382137.1 hypothetical protein [Paraburkholderia caribensis]